MAITSVNNPYAKPHRIVEQAPERIVIRPNTTSWFSKVGLPVAVLVLFLIPAAIWGIYRIATGEGKSLILPLAVILAAIVGTLIQLRSKWIHAFTVTAQGLFFEERSLFGRQTTACPSDRMHWLILDISRPENARLLVQTGTEGPMLFYAGPFEEAKRTAEMVSTLWHLPLEWALMEPPTLLSLQQIIVQGAQQARKLPRNSQRDSQALVKQYYHDMAMSGRWIRFQPSSGLFTVQETEEEKRTYAMSDIADLLIREIKAGERKQVEDEDDTFLYAYEVWLTLTSGETFRLKSTRSVEKKQTLQSVARQEAEQIISLLQSLRPEHQYSARHTDVSENLQRQQNR